MKRLLSSFLALVALTGAAFAQVNFVPQTGLTTGYLPKLTFSAAFFGLVPVVTAATDQVCIAGSASKTIRVQRITVFGTTATAPQAVPINLLKRLIADTAGTAGTTTANPANTIAKRDTSNTGTPSATLISYTAAPTVNDASPTYIDSQLMTMPVITGVQTATPVDFFFARDIENQLQVPALIGVAQQLCVNNGAALTNASAWNGSIVWTEE